MKPDKGDWLAIVNVFAPSGLARACLSPFRLAVCAAENRSGKGEQAAICVGLDHFCIGASPLFQPTNNPG